MPAHTRSLARLVAVVEELVAGYNEAFASESMQETGSGPDGQEATDSPKVIDMVALNEAVALAARQYSTFLMDMARAEAFDAMGENQAAVAIVERHVQQLDSQISPQMCRPVGACLAEDVPLAFHLSPRTHQVL